MKKLAISDFPKFLAIKLIEVYQFLLSPDHSWLKTRFPYGYCRHYPSCSQYSKLVIQKLGLLKGGFLAVKRIISCNPFVESRVDHI